MAAAGVSAVSLGVGAAGPAAADSAGAPGAPGVLGGQSVLPGDPRYQTLSQGFNQRWSSRPAYIRLVGSDADVVAALKTALDKGLRPTIRGGGHCYEGFVDNDRGVILDLSTLRGVRAARDKFGAPTYCVEGGATNWDVYTSLFRTYGVTLPAGSCYSVGAGGHVSGGGYGLLSRRDGLTVDHLVQVDVVTVRGGTVELTTAHRDDPATSPESDLFWAHTGGGGGNFGVVLRYHFAARLPKPPPRVWLSSVAWSWADLLKHPEDFRRLVENFGSFFAQHSGPKETVYRGLFAILKLTHRTNGNVVLLSQWDEDDPAPLEEFLAAMEAGLTSRAVVQSYAAGGVLLPYPDKRRQMPWFQATMTLNPSGANQRGKYKSAYHRRRFTPTHIDAFWEWLTKTVPGVDLTQTLVQIDSYGCRINEHKPAEAAIPQRDSVMKLQYQTYWTDPAQDAAHLAYLGGLYQAVYRATNGIPEIDTDTDGAYVNYPDVDLGTADQKQPAYQRLYYKQNYARLQRAKKTWDETNVFHHAQSITLPS
ncbi:FAD-binding oxidoreductase [Kitasatospora sp. NPDC005751]|uniref:FAD-binding oxidoreductase n=1 Tax=Kitasatospora sp. NPDC005751 TaxID=3157064 RepID=UPI003411DAAB